MTTEVVSGASGQLMDACDAGQLSWFPSSGLGTPVLEALLRASDGRGDQKFHSQAGAWERVVPFHYDEPLPQAVKTSIRVYWWRGGPRQGNFGDVLTPVLCERLARRPVEHADINDASLVAIGSLLEPHFYSAGTWDEYTGFVWGSGRMFAGQERLRLTNARVTALRGHLTNDRVIHSAGPQAALGDPVLLCNDLARPVRKRYKLGVVPHFKEYPHPFLREFADRSPEITMIDICGGVQSVIDQILQCEFLLSSALHGLVAADALGVPNEWLWLDLVDHRRAGKPAFKYRDYYSLFGLQDKQPLHLRANDTLDDILSRIGPSERPGLTQIQKRLLDAFPFAA